MRRHFVRAFSLLALLAIGCQDAQEAPGTPSMSGETDEELLVRAREIHDRTITIDTHDDIPTTFGSDEVDPGVRGDRQVDLPKMREGGLDVAFFIVYVGQSERTPENYQAAYDDAMAKFNGIRRMALETRSDEIGLALSPDDVREIVGSGRLATVIGVENSFSIGQDLANVEAFYDLGARYMGLVHNGHNDLADSAQPRPQQGDVESEHDGISDFGAQAVAEMNRLGIMVDVSHASKGAMLDAVEMSRAPIIASHSSVKALADHPRNMDDEQLMAMRDNGGVIQTVALGSYVKTTPQEKTDAIQALRDEMGITGGRGGMQNLTPEQRTAYDERMATIEEQWPSANVQDFVDHIDYMVEMIGVDHVGISSDFDGGGGITGWEDASETFNVTLELVRRGYTEEDIAKIWGGNLLRVWSAVDSVAAEIQAGG